MPVQASWRQRPSQSASAGQLRARTACNSLEIHSFIISGANSQPCTVAALPPQACHHFGQRGCSGGGRVPRWTQAWRALTRMRRVSVGRSRKPVISMPPAALLLVAGLSEHICTSTHYGHTKVYARHLQCQELKAQIR